MKSLIFGSAEYVAEKIIKTDDSIIGYIGHTEVFSFRDVSDFSVFSFSDKQQEFDTPEPKIEDKFNQLQEEKDALAETLDMLLTEIIPNLTGGN